MAICPCLLVPVLALAVPCRSAVVLANLIRAAQCRWRPLMLLLRVRVAPWHVYGIVCKLEHQARSAFRPALPLPAVAAALPLTLAIVAQAQVARPPSLVDRAPMQVVVTCVSTRDTARLVVARPAGWRRQRSSRWRGAAHQRRQ